jgi:hypothetical protein
MIKHKIVIDELFKSRGIANNNIIPGIILGVLSRKHILFKSDDPLHLDELTGHYLLLHIQYVNQAKNKNSNAVPVEVALILIDTYSWQDEQYLEENSKYIMTGTLIMD